MPLMITASSMRRWDLEDHSKFCQTSKMKIFCEKNQRLSVVKYLREKLHLICLTGLLIRLVTDLRSLQQIFLKSFLPFNKYSLAISSLILVYSFGKFSSIVKNLILFLPVKCFRQILSTLRFLKKAFVICSIIVRISSYLQRFPKCRLANLKTIHAVTQINI